MAEYFQIDKDLLNVPLSHNLEDLGRQAKDITFACVGSRSPVCIVMMHTPSVEQITDLEALGRLKGRPIALVGGQLGLMINVVGCLKVAGFVVVEALTERVSEEVVLPDGSTKKLSVFKHRGLRELTLPSLRK